MCFLDATEKAHSTKKKYTGGFIKNKIFCSAKDTSKKMKGWAIDWEKISATHISNKRLHLKYTKELLKLKKITQLKNEQKILTNMSQKIYG